jgi:hypothetical protein
VPGRVDGGRFVGLAAVAAAAEGQLAAPVREEDVEEEEDAAGPRAADLHGHRRPDVKVEILKIFFAKNAKILKMLAVM